MANLLFTNVRILDGSGAQPYPGEVLVQGNRISRVTRGVRAISTSGVTVIDAAGATLMPGMTEAHTHFSWNDQPSLGAIQRMPTEEHILWCAPLRANPFARRTPQNETSVSPGEPNDGRPGRASLNSAKFADHDSGGHAVAHDKAPCA